MENPTFSSMKYSNENVTLKDLFRNPIFLIQLILLVNVFLLNSYLLYSNRWPPFCFENSWGFFNNCAVLFSLALIDSSILITWIVFENHNWVYYVSHYIIHALLLEGSSALFLYNYYNGCSVKLSIWPIKMLKRGENGRYLIDYKVQDFVVQCLISTIGVFYFALGLCYAFLRGKVIN